MKHPKFVVLTILIVLTICSTDIKLTVDWNWKQNVNKSLLYNVSNPLCYRSFPDTFLACFQPVFSRMIQAVLGLALSNAMPQSLQLENIFLS